MKAVQFTEYGGPEVLEVSEVEEPHAEAGQVRIAVHAAGVNPLDAKVRSGAMQQVIPWPFPPGRVWTPRDRGRGRCRRDRRRSRRRGLRLGLLDARGAHRAASSGPRSRTALSFEEAAGYPAVVETAVRILDQVGVQPGQTLVVSGAAGGVGTATVQFARERGITVIGTASAGNQDYVRSLGATPRRTARAGSSRVASPGARWRRRCSRPRRSPA